MNELQKSFIENSPSFLMHYNHNHDPKTGRFTNSLFVSGSSKTQDKEAESYRHDYSYPRYYYQFAPPRKKK